MKKLYNDAPFSIKKKGTSNEELATQLAQIPKQLNTLYNAGRIMESKLAPYVAWPFGCLFWDESTKKFGLFLNAKSEHNSTDGSLYFISKGIEESKYSNPVLVGTNAGNATLSHGAGILKNGDYLAIAKISNNGNEGVYKNNLYRSTDKGATWTENELKINGQTYNGAGWGDLYSLQNGRVISYTRELDGSKHYVLYSDDYGYTWNKSEVANPTGFNMAMETKFCQLSNGVIIAIIRADLFTPASPRNALFTKSTDNGNTWQPLQVSTLKDMTANNSAILRHADTKTLEIFYASRSQNLAGKGSLYQLVVSEEDAENNNFPDPTIMTYGTANPNFGYPAIAMSNDGLIEFMYYKEDVNGGTDIYRMVGQKGLGNVPKIKLPNVDKEGNEIPQSGEVFISTLIPINSDSYENGTLSAVVGQPAELQSSATRLRLKDFESVGASKKFKVNNNNTNFKINVRQFDVSYNNNGETGWVDDAIITTSTTTAYIKILIKKSDDSAISVSDLKNVKFSFDRYTESKVKRSLYDNGNEHQFYTGLYVNSTINNGTVTNVKNFNNLETSFANQTTLDARAFFMSTNSVDMSNYTKLKVNVIVSGLTGSCDASLRVYNKSNPTSSSDGRLALVTTTTNGSKTLEIDLTTISTVSPLYLALGVAKPGNTVDSSINAKFYEMWLE